MSGRRKPQAPSAAPPALQHPIVEVTWLDAAFDLDSEPPLYTLRTYGFLIRQDSDRIVIASEGDGSYFRSYTVIPAGWVLSIARLTPVTP